MLCENEEECFTITWKIDNFRNYSSPEVMESIRSPVWKTDTTEDSTWWRFLINSVNLNLDIALVIFNAELKEKNFRYEMSLLTPSGEVQLIRELFCDYACCSYRIGKNKIFGETSNSFLQQGTLTLCCRIWQPSLKRGRCLLRTVLHAVNFPWCIEGFSLDSDSTKRSLHQQGKTLLNMFIYSDEAEKSTHKVRVEVLPDSGRWSAFMSCNISIKGGCGQVISSNCIFPMVSWEWDVEIYPKRCQNNNLHLEFQTIIGIEVEQQQLSITSDAGPGSSNTLSDDILQLYKKNTLSDVTLNTEDKSFQAHTNILATRSTVFHAMFEKDKMIEGFSGVVDIEDIDSETMDRLLVYLYSDKIDNLQWEQASALYYAADKYAVLNLKQKCAEILMVGLTAGNVCEALILADRHSDEQLMSCAADYR